MSTSLPSLFYLKDLHINCPALTSINQPAQYSNLSLSLLPNSGNNGLQVRGGGNVGKGGGGGGIKKCKEGLRRLTPGCGGRILSQSARVQDARGPHRCIGKQQGISFLNGEERGSLSSETL